MWKTHGKGRYFMLFIRLRKDAPRVHRSSTHEIKPPYRISNSLLIRIFGERSIVLGKWTSYAKDEDDAMVRALSAKKLPNDKDDDGRLVGEYWGDRGQRAA